jgi:hypothetical protein
MVVPSERCHAGPVPQQPASASLSEDGRRSVRRSWYATARAAPAAAAGPRGGQTLARARAPGRRRRGRAMLPHWLFEQTA